MDANNPADPIRQMFNALAENYDRGNTILTFGLAKHWRRQAAKLAGHNKAPETLLDVACGTGDFTAISKCLYPACHMEGLDFAEEMLAIARKKYPNITFRQGDASALPYPASSFDAVTVGYGLRNFTDRAAVLAEIHRVLKLHGRLVILEAVKPESYLTRLLFKLYWLAASPVLHLLTRQGNSYAYLKETMQAMPAESELQQLFQQAGFSQITRKRIACGMNLIVCLEKQESISQ